MANQGIMHASYSNGGNALCRASIPRLNSAETAVAIEQDGKWKTYGKDIQAVRRTWGSGK